MPDTQILVFEPFWVDLDNEQLWRGKDVLQLTYKDFSVLRYLVEHPKQLVTRKALLEAVWPETHVVEAVLTVCIHELRQALGDSPRTPQFIQTVRGRGYRFLVPVTVVDKPPARHEADPFASRTPAPSLRRSPSTVHRSVPLVDREAELAQLYQWFATALRGERQIVFIAGEAGIGKTTLVEALVAQLGTEEALWIGRGQCIDQYGAGEAYLPILEALGRLARAPEGTGLVEILRQQAPSWLVQMPALVPEAERDVLQRTGSATTRARMLRELAEAVETLTAERPLVLVLEDLHWSDPSTLAWLAYAARRPDQARLLVLGTYRPVETIVRDNSVRTMTRELLRHGQCAELVLDYLSEEGVAAYLAHRCGGHALPRELARLIHQRTNGNPLFMINVVDDAVRRGMLQEGPEGWELPSGIAAVTLGVPESLRQLIEQLQSTRDELAAAERESGRLAERQRLARDLHDTLAQGFVSIVLQLQAAEGELPAGADAARAHLERARRTASDNLTEVRQLVWDLRPESLRAASLGEALGRLTDRLAEETGVAVTAAVTGTPRPLSPDAEVTLLRVTQEALANVRKHARAGRVALTLSYMDGEAALDVRDDGVGFVGVDGSGPNGGLGLHGMRERVAALGGRLAVESAPGAGTTVAVTVPIA